MSELLTAAIEKRARLRERANNLKIAIAGTRESNPHLDALRCFAQIKQGSAWSVDVLISSEIAKPLFQAELADVLNQIEDIDARLARAEYAFQEDA